MGLVAGVSFIATPIKFRAASLTIPVALDVGHVTLHALNRIEWLLAALLALLVAHFRDRLGRIAPGLAILAIGLVILQSVWLLPMLDVRTEMVIQGQSLPPSPLHALFIAAETLKLLALGALGAFAARPVAKSSD